jgi:flagellar biosynthesis protein FlhB
MADGESKESQTEEPTEKKIGDAIERGDVPFSREASLFASIAGMLIIGAFTAKGAIAATTALLRQLLDDCGGVSIRNGNDAVALLQIVGRGVSAILVGPLVILSTAGILSSVLQNPPRLVFDRIQPDLKRISLANGWHRLFGSRGQIEFLKGVLKLGSISAVLFTVLQWQQNNLVNAMAVDPEAVPEMILSIAMRLLSVVGVVTMLLLAADLVWARTHWRRDLRMSRQELKDEIKQNEGDPLKKAKLRSLAQDRQRRSMIANVPKATLVIANPTHFAIALRYVKEENAAPLVLSKGQDLIALKIREIAEQHGIPVIEDKLLARSMYESVEVDRTIPPEFYKAVAELIHFLGSRKAHSASVK